MSTVDEAFEAVDRADFIPDKLKKQAQLDMPLPIGFGQTISQPTTVRLMLGWLEPKPGNKVLDIGSGSGWSTALLAFMVGPKGKIYAVERIPELLEFGKQNCQKSGFLNTEFYIARKDYGLLEFAPYDRILVSAAAEDFPEDLVNQLAGYGKMVIPVRSNVLEITKTSKTAYETIAHPGFVFVPLIRSS